MVLGGWIIIIELHYMVFGGFGGWCCFDQQMCVVGLNCINVFFDMWINRWSNGLWFTYTGTGATTKSLKALLNVEPCLDPLTWTNDHGWIDVQQRFGGGLLRCSSETSAALRILFWATSGTKPAPPLWGCRHRQEQPPKKGQEVPLVHWGSEDAYESSKDLTKNPQGISPNRPGDSEVIRLSLSPPFWRPFDQSPSAPHL